LLLAESDKCRKQQDGLVQYMVKRSRVRRAIVFIVAATVRIEDATTDKCLFHIESRPYQVPAGTH
jgi:hypothetical protein